MNTIGRGLEVALRLVGVWPGVRYALLCKFYWVSTMAIFQLFQYRYFLMRFGSIDLSSLIDSLSTSLPYTLLCLKLGMMWMNESVLHDVLSSMAKDWQNNSAIEPKAQMMRRVAYRSRRTSNIIMGLYSTSVVLYVAGIIVSNYKSGEYSKVPSRELPLKIELPFDIEKSPIFEVVFLVEFLHQVGAATTSGMMSALLLALILHLGGQIDIIRHDIVVSKGSEDIGRLIKRHREIINFSRNVERLFTYIALMQFFSSTVVICCLGFLIVISLGTAEGTVTLIKSVLFYIVICVDAFIFCFAGEYLSTKSHAIGHATYASFWYDLSPNESRMLMLLMLRSQKALTISIGKFMDLSLERFTTIIKASGSYMSVLLALY